jgi:protein-disulfide isomerase
MKPRLILLAILLLGTCSMAAAQAAPATAQAPRSTAAAPAKANTAAAVPSGSQASPQSQLILANADKLVDLAQQLKTEVDKSNQYTLSVNALRRAGDVEKLAKDLQKQIQHSKK